MPSHNQSQRFCVRYGPWALVAGASEGIGAAFAEQLAQQGLNLILVARRPDPLDRLGTKIEAEYGVEIRRVPLDLARPDVAAALDAEISDLEVGLLVYNAALSVIGPFFDQPIERHMTELDVNCRGQLALVSQYAPPMIGRGRGGIILMSSMAGFQGTPIVAHYAATKAYGRVFAEGMWDELRGSGVDVLACAAGATRTPAFESSKPASSSAPIMEADQAVREALAALGHKPTLIPGRLNRLASVLMTRLLPRATAVRIMGKNTRAMYPE